MSDPASRLNAALEGQYRIERQLGEGGMATVYLAEDVKHNRNVALKVLKPELAAVVGAERFLAEIQTTANLQHPHILPLFDSGEADGFLFYVMPFVEGVSLQDRLDREHQLPVDEAVRIATNVSEALDYAHRHGVIHRDIKPANILLQDGKPVVADFGIALAVGAAGGGRLTETGLSLGTPHYMSPEQATGDVHVGPAADIYALGCVLYEMLVGEPPYTGSTPQSILGKIITADVPSASTERKSVPPNVDAVIRKALQKVPADRFGSASEMAEALAGRRTVELPDTASDVRARVQRSASPWRTWALAAAGGVVIGAAVTALVVQPGPGTSAFTPPPTYGQLVRPADIDMTGSIDFGMEISPDGAAMALVGVRGGQSAVYVRSLRSPDAEPTLLSGTEGARDRLRFSPDGTALLFRRGAQHWVVDVAGGTPRSVIDSVSSVDWGDGDRIVMRDGPNLEFLSLESGEVQPLANIDRVQGYARFGRIKVLPGGDAAVVELWTDDATVDGARLGVVTIPGGEVTDLGVPGVSPSFVSPGYLVFARGNGSLYAARFSLDQLRVEGPAVPVLDNVRVSSTGEAAFRVSRNGTLIWDSREASGTWLVRVDRAGAPRRLLRSDTRIGWPRVSRDGTKIAYTVRTDGLYGDIWYYDLATETPTRVTVDGINGRPEWMPDGARLAFISSPSGGSTFDLHVRSQRWDRMEQPDTFLAPASLNGIGEISFGPPGSLAAIRTLSGSAVPGNAERDIYIAPVDSLGALRPLLTSAEVAFERPRVSPDGALIAYVATINGVFDVFVQPLSGPGGRTQVSVGGGEEPVWSADGRVLYYRTAHELVAATLQRQPSLRVTDREVLFADGFERSNQRANYDVLGDGFVMVEAAQPSNVISFIVNWGEELRERLEGQ